MSCPRAWPTPLSQLLTFLGHTHTESDTCDPPTLTSQGRATCSRCSNWPTFSCHVHQLPLVTLSLRTWGDTMKVIPTSLLARRAAIGAACGWLVFLSVEGEDAHGPQVSVESKECDQELLLEARSVGAAHRAARDRQPAEPRHPPAKSADEKAYIEVTTSLFTSISIDFVPSPCSAFSQGSIE